MEEEEEEEEAEGALIWTRKTKQRKKNNTMSISEANLRQASSDEEVCYSYSLG